MDMLKNDYKVMLLAYMDGHGIEALLFLFLFLYVVK